MGVAEEHRLGHRVGAGVKADSRSGRVRTREAGWRHVGAGYAHCEVARQRGAAVVIDHVLDHN